MDFHHSVYLVYIDKLTIAVHLMGNLVECVFFSMLFQDWSVSVTLSFLLMYYLLQTKNKLMTISTVTFQLSSVKPVVVPLHLNHGKTNDCRSLQQ